MLPPDGVWVIEANLPRVCYQSRINSEAATALGLDPEERTAQQRHAALVSLRTTVKQFSEYPLGMQESLVTVGVYQR